MPKGVYEHKPHQLFQKGHSFITGSEKHWFKKGVHPSTEIKEGQWSGEKHPNWRGGKIIDKDGYVLVHKRTHPFCNADGYIREHRLVIEKIIGRYLSPTEKVHHTSKKNDNRAQKLMAFKTQTAHLRFEKDLSIAITDIIFDGRNWKKRKGLLYP